MTTTTKKTRTTRTKPVVETTTKETKLPPNPFMNEILDFVSEKETDEDKIKALKEYENDALKALFIWNFDNTVISVLPQGEVPFRPNENPLGTDHSSLRREFKHLYNFVKGGNDTLSTIRRETIFIQILESLHPNEAEVLCLVKDKDLTSKYDIPFEVVEKAYPDIKWGGRS
jgi:Family of unknown function (DUF6433)